MERDIKKIVKLALLVEEIDTQIFIEKANLVRFTERFLKDPADAFSWGEEHVEAAAKIKLFETAKWLVQNKVAADKTELAIDEYYAMVAEEIGGRYSIIPRASSMIHNVMETYLADQAARFVARKWEYGSVVSQAQWKDPEYKAWQQAEWAKEKVAKELAEATAKAQKALERKAAKDAAKKG